MESIPGPLQNVLSDQPLFRGEQGRVLVFGNKNEVGSAFDSFYSGSSASPELLQAQKMKHFAIGEGYTRMEQIVSSIEKNFSPDSIIIEIGGNVFQKRSANACERLKHYYPLDISEANMQLYSRTFGKVSLAANAEKLPFRDQSIDCIFTHTFLEHPTHPEKVLKEIARVIKPGGWVIHNDAWFCRWWQRFGVFGLKKFKNMTLREKFISLSAAVSEWKILRIPPVIMLRLLRSTLGSEQFHYVKLKPNYDLHIGCDEDAASSIDPVEVIRFYERNGFETQAPLSFLRRLRYRNEPVFLKKRFTGK